MAHEISDRGPAARVLATDAGDGADAAGLYRGRQAPRALLRPVTGRLPRVTRLLPASCLPRWKETLACRAPRVGDEAFSSFTEALARRHRVKAGGCRQRLRVQTEAKLARRHRVKAGGCLARFTPLVLVCLAIRP